MDANQRAYERFVHIYTWKELWPAERVILERFKDQWNQIRMLDLGVGTGRTAYTFAALTREYLGIDYVPAMIEKCLQEIGESDCVHFSVGDARDLSRFPESFFDFVLFSWNGIDNVSHEGRKKILAEVRRVLQNDGHFFFSTHNLNAFPFRVKPAVLDPRMPLRSVYRWLWATHGALRLRWMYQNVDVKAIKARPYAILIHPDHRFRLKVYFIRPDYQLEQLSDAGFETLSVLDQHGREINPRKTQERGYLSFLCRPKKMAG